MATYPPPLEIVPIWNELNFLTVDQGASMSWVLANFLKLTGGILTGALVINSNLAVTGTTSTASLYTTGATTHATTLNVIGASTLAGLTATTISASSDINTVQLNSTNIRATTLTSTNIFSTTLTSNSSIYSPFVFASTVSSGIGKLTNLTSTTVTTSTLYTTGATTLATTLNVIGASTLAGLTATTITCSSSLYSGLGTISTLTTAIGNITNISNSTITSSNMYANTISGSGSINSGTGNFSNLLSSTITTSTLYTTGATTHATTLNVIGASVFAGLTATSLTTGGSLNVGGAGYIAGNFGVSGSCFFGSTLGVSGAINCSTILCAAISCSALYASSAVVCASTVSVIGASTLAGLTATTITGSTSINSGTGNFTNLLSTTVTTSTLYTIGATTLATTLNVIGASTLAGLTATTITGSTSINSGTGNFTNVLSTTVTTSTLYTTGATTHATTLNVIGASTLAGLTASTITGSTSINSGTGNLTNIVSSAITNSGNISIGTASNTSTGFIYMSDILYANNPVRISNYNTLKFEYYGGILGWVTLMTVSVVGMTVVPTFIASGGISSTTISASTAIYSGTCNCTNILSSTVTTALLYTRGATTMASTFNVLGDSTLAGLTATTITGSTSINSGTGNFTNVISTTVTTSTLYTTGATTHATTLNVIGASTLAGLTASTITGSTSINSGTGNFTNLLSTTVTTATLYTTGATTHATTLNVVGAFSCGNLSGAACSFSSLNVSGTTTMTGQLVTTTQAIFSRVGVGNNASTFSFTGSYASQLQIGSLNSGNDFGFSMAMSNVYARFRETSVVNQIKIGTNWDINTGLQDNISYPSWAIEMGNDDFHIMQARPNGGETTVFSMNASTVTSVNSMYINGLVLPTSGGTATQLNYYEEATVAVIVQTSFNFSTIYSGNVYFVRVGKLVTMRIPVLRANLLGGFIYCPYLNGVPARFRPSGTTSVSFSIPVVDLGVYQNYPGQLIVWYTGQFIIYMTAAGSGNFSSGANSGTGTDVVVSWSLY